MRHTLLANALFAMAIPLAAASTAQAKETTQEVAAGAKVIRLTPKTAWNMNYTEHTCRLARAFEYDGKRYLFTIEQAAPRSGFSLTLAGPQMARFQHNRLQIGTTRDEKPRTVEKVGRGEVEGYGPAVMLGSMTLGDSEKRTKLSYAGIKPENAERMDQLIVKRGGKVVSFETGNMAKPFEALNTCTVSLLKEWGLDPAKHTAYQPPIPTDLQKVARRLQQTYPREALSKNDQGVFKVQLIIEADGSVKSCHLEQLTVANSLKSPACKEMRKVKFAPARDSNGQPMRSFYATTITYAIG